MVAFRCRWSGEWVLVVSCYCAPSEDIDLVFEQVDKLLGTYPDDNVVLVGDLNAKSTIGGKQPIDPRGRSLIVFASNANLAIVNDPDSLPIFCGAQKEGWTDVLLLRFCASRITDWLISDVETLSDHCAMPWTYQGRPTQRLPGGANRR